MNVFQTPGAFSWSELMTPDPKAAGAFYAQLFGWKVDEMPMGEMGTYRVAKVGDTAVGGMMAMPPDAPAGMPPVWSVYVTVADCDQAAAQCKALGGGVLKPPMDIPGVGRMAVLHDPQGAVFCVMAYAMPS
jgi:predicted enzyme related to lactoylglutathione lyase